MSKPTITELPTSNSAGVSFGFIGIGNMGWHMAMNILKKMNSDSHMTICDVNSARVAQMLDAGLQIAPHRVDSAKSPMEVVEKAVGAHYNVLISTAETSHRT